MGASPRNDWTARSGLEKVVWIVLAVVFVWLVFVALTLAIRTGLFDFGSDLSNDRAKSVWAFVGTALGAVGALIAVLFAASYQDRTQKLAEQTEKRQRDEAAAGFLALLSREEISGKKPTAAQYVGVVLSLRALQHTQAARGVFSAAIDDGDLPPSALALLLEAPLCSPDEQGRRVGARLLMMAAGHLTNSDTDAWDWPDALSTWPANYPRDAEINVVAAIGRTLASQPVDFWKGRKDWAVYLLDEALSAGTDNGVRDSAHELQLSLLGSYTQKPAALNRGEERECFSTFIDRAQKYKTTAHVDTAVRREIDSLKSMWRGVTALQYPKPEVSVER